jgi:hypothetical protein
MANIVKSSNGLRAMGFASVVMLALFNPVPYAQRAAAHFPRSLFSRALPRSIIPR